MRIRFRQDVFYSSTDIGNLSVSTSNSNFNGIGDPTVPGSFSSHRMGTFQEYLSYFFKSPIPGNSPLK
ncbi:MAG: hypothetical protein QMC40_01305 [Vicingaceae bacterium]